MNKNFRLKLSKFISIVMVVILCLSVLPAKVYAGDLKAAVSTINGVLPADEYQIQVTRYTTEGERVVGQCHICALTNLLNRKLALDGKYSTNNRFDLEYVARINCYALPDNNLTVEEAESGITCSYNSELKRLICDYDTEGYKNKPILTVGNTNYMVISTTIESDPEAQIARLLDEYNEGVFVRANYTNKNGHCFVVTNYEIVNGEYQFTVVDTANSLNGEESLANSYIGKRLKENNRAVKLNANCVNKIVYLEETSERAAFVKNGSSISEPPVVTPTMQFSITSVPTTLTKGSSFNLAGTISSNCTITNATAIIKQNGVPKYTAVVSPNSKSLNIKTSNLNYKLPFGKLPAGNYTLVFTAKAEGETFTSKTYSFTVKEKAVTPTMTFSITSVPTTLTRGSSFNIAGTISSNCTITNATAIIKQNGVPKYTAVVSPNSKSLNIKTSNLNYKLPFGKLPAGKYTLVFTAKAEGKTFTSRTYSFTVK